jgi:hypothetical protein
MQAESAVSAGASPCAAAAAGASLPRARVARPHVFGDLFREMDRFDDPLALMLVLPTPPAFSPAQDKRQHRELVKSLLKDASLQQIVGSCARCDLKQHNSSKLATLLVFSSEAECASAASAFSAAQFHVHQAKAQMSYAVFDSISTSISIDIAQKQFESVGLTQVRVVRPVRSRDDHTPVPKLCVGFPSRCVDQLLSSNILSLLSVAGLHAQMKKWEAPDRVCTKCWSVGHPAHECKAANPRCPLCSGSHDVNQCSLKASGRSAPFACPLCNGSHSGFTCGTFRGRLCSFVPQAEYQQRRASAHVPQPPAASSYPPLPRRPNPAGWPASPRALDSDKISSLEKKVDLLMDQNNRLMAVVEKQSQANTELASRLTSLASTVAHLVGLVSSVVESPLRKAKKTKASAADTAASISGDDESVRSVNPQLATSFHLPSLSAAAAASHSSHVSSSPPPSSAAVSSSATPPHRDHPPCSPVESTAVVSHPAATPQVLTTPVPQPAATHSSSRSACMDTSTTL